jgi:tetratricopeptide (TPR) repeat protein
MRLPVSFLLRALGLLAAASCALPSIAQSNSASGSERARLHQSEQWLAIQAHLPNPATASAHELEVQGDILRARRFPEDAMDYFNYALARGGNAASLMNKIGLTELEMRNVQIAHSYFQRVVKLDKKDAEGWNNLGAVEYLQGTTESAISDYKKAVKLDRHDAVFHANLATAYFEEKDYTRARREISSAMALDPTVFEHAASIGGISAHVLSSEDRARFSFEMAEIYARNGQEEAMVHSLAMASEAGMDVQREMRKSVVLAKFEMDPRVLVLVHNAQALRTSRDGTASATAPVTALPESKPVVE